MRRASEEQAATIESDNRTSPIISEVQEEFEHGLAAGDHVIRWSMIALWPIQIHGIVLAAGPDVITLVDFGLTSSRMKDEKAKDKGNDGSTKEDDSGGELEFRGQEEAIMKEWKKRESNCSRRFTVLTLTEKKQFKQWKKVNYGESPLSAGKLQKLMSWFRKKKDDDSQTDASSSAYQSEYTSLADLIDEEEDDEEEEEEEEEILERKISVKGMEQKLQPQSISSTVQPQSISSTQNTTQSESIFQEGSQKSKFASSSKGSQISLDETATATSSDSDQDDGSKKDPPKSEGILSSWRSPKKADTSSCNQIKDAPKLPKSDPTGIVLERVRFILEHENRKDEDDSKPILPPYHLFNANSECIAVWCKTGTFSNLQAAVFLHSTALGQAKSATCLSLFVASQTVAVTSPATGIMGWFGYTTTTQVALLSTQPWLIPVLAGYGIAAVGTPYVLLLRAQDKWKKATQELNDRFWSSAGPEVFVEAIHTWSGLR